MPSSSRAPGYHSTQGVSRALPHSARSREPEAVPEVDRQYQSTDVPGLYIVGALIGSPLIKQAMNQGYDVVEFIHGRSPCPADYPLINARVSGLPYALDAEDLLDLYRRGVLMFRRMSALSFRERLSKAASS